MTSKGETRCLKISKLTLISGVEKTKRFVYKSRPGKHTGKTSLPIGVVIRDMLHVADNGREVNYILNQKDVLVDKRQVKSTKIPIGLFDVIDIPKLKKSYRLVYAGNGTFVCEEISGADAKYKICKIVSKKIAKGNKVQLVTNDGRTIMTTNNAYKPKASIKLDLEENTIKEYFPIDKGRSAIVIGGKHVGQKAKIIGVSEATMQKPMIIKLKDNDKEFETTEKNIVVIN